MAGSAFAHIAHGNWADATIIMNRAIPISEDYYPDFKILTYNVMFAVAGVKGDWAEAGFWKNKFLRHTSFSHCPNVLSFLHICRWCLYGVNSGSTGFCEDYADTLIQYINKYGKDDPRLKTIPIWHWVFFMKNFNIYDRP